MVPNFSNHIPFSMMDLTLAIKLAIYTLEWGI